MNKPFVNKTIIFAIIMAVLATFDYLNRKQEKVQIENINKAPKVEYLVISNSACEQTSPFEEKICTILAQNNKEFISFKVLARYQALIQKSFIFQYSDCPAITIPDGRSFNAVCNSLFTKPKENKNLTP